MYGLRTHLIFLIEIRAINEIFRSFSLRIDTQKRFVLSQRRPKVPSLLMKRYRARREAKVSHYLHLRSVKWLYRALGCTYRYRRAAKVSCFQVGIHVAHPGVANDFGDITARKYYPYYQWVCFVLFFQVGSELLPHPLFLSAILPHVRHGERAPCKEEEDSPRRSPHCCPFFMHIHLSFR